MTLQEKTPDISTELHNMKNGIKILDYLDSKFRMELITQLLLKHESSLSEITEAVSKSKATVSKHLQELAELGFLDIREEKVRGPIKKNYYSLKENVFKYLCANRILVRHLPEEERNTIYQRLIEHSNKEMELIRQIMDSAELYNEKLINKVKEYSQFGDGLTKKTYLHNRMLNFLFALDEPELQIFFEEYQKFTARLVERFEKYRSKPDYTYHGKNSLIWVAYFPMEKIMKEELTLDFLDKEDISINKNKDE